MFILLLLGPGAGFYLTLSAAYDAPLRYWSILIAIGAMLLALAARRLLLGAAANSRFVSMDFAFAYYVWHPEGRGLPGGAATAGICGPQQYQRRPVSPG